MKIRFISPFLQSYFLVFALLFLFNSCKKDTEDPMAESIKLNVEQLSGYPGTIISVNHEFENVNNDFTGEMAGISLQMVALNNELSFIIPQIEKGSYDLKIKVNGGEHSFGFEVLDSIEITDADKYLSDFISDLEKEISEGDEVKDSLIKNGQLDEQIYLKDKAEWDAWQTDAEAELASLSSEQRKHLAQYLEANKNWLNDLSILSEGSYLRMKKSSACEEIRESALALNASGDQLWALSLAPKYFWCKAKDYVNQNTNGFVAKASLLWQNVDTHYATVWLANMIGRKIEKLGNDIASIGQTTFVADDFSEPFQYKTSLSWCSGERKSIFVKVKFRTPRRSDIDVEGSLGAFASTYSDFIESYDQYFATSRSELVWRPEFLNASKSIDFNRNLSIPVSSITNKEVVLVNTQHVNDKWEVIFATDNPDNQDFDYDIVYSDGDITIKRTFTAKVYANDKCPDILNMKGKWLFYTVNYANDTTRLYRITVTHVNIENGDTIYWASSNSYWESKNLYNGQWYEYSSNHPYYFYYRSKSQKLVISLVGGAYKYIFNVPDIDARRFEYTSQQESGFLERL